MKCQSLFSAKKKQTKKTQENIFSLSSAEFVLEMVKFKDNILYFCMKRVKKKQNKDKIFVSAPIYYRITIFTQSIPADQLEQTM